MTVNTRYLWSQSLLVHVHHEVVKPSRRRLELWRRELWAPIRQKSISSWIDVYIRNWNTLQDIIWVRVIHCQHLTVQCTWSNIKGCQVLWLSGEHEDLSELLQGRRFHLRWWTVCQDIPVTRVSDVYKLTFPLAHMFIAVVTAMCQDGGEVQPGAGLQRHVWWEWMPTDCFWKQLQQERPSNWIDSQRCSCQFQHLYDEGGGDRPIHPPAVWDQHAVERKPREVSKLERRHIPKCPNRDRHHTFILSMNF